jgi:predicted CopG family antitoxin
VRPYKTIRLSDETFKATHKLKRPGESLTSFINNLLVTYATARCRICKQEGKYFFETDNGIREMPIRVPVNNDIRVSAEVYDKLVEIQEHPDETFNTTLFRLVTCATKEEVKKPYILCVFAFPQEEWFDEKGDFKYFIPECFTGPMMASAMIVDSVNEISKIPKIAERVDVQIISCHDVELQKKYFKRSFKEHEYPILTFGESDRAEGTYMLCHGISEEELRKWILDTI